MDTDLWSDPDPRAACALSAAEAGAAVAADAFRTGIDVETKGEKTDVVTEADREAQRTTTAVIREGYGGEPIVGEEDETPDSIPEEGPAWVVDPIDGTANFVRGIGMWATSVAAVVDGEPVAGATVAPALEDRFLLDGDAAFLNGEPLSVSDRTDPEEFVVVPTIWWPPDRRGEYAAACRGIVERFGDMRRYGSAQLELALCAAGAVEGLVTNVSPNPWDAVVGAGLIEAAGGRVTDVEGNPWRHDSRGLVASNGAAHDRILAVADEIEAARRE